MKEELEQLLNSERAAGLYRIEASAEPETVKRMAEEHGWRFFHWTARR